MHIRILLFTGIILLLSCSLFGTEQTPDRIIYKGETYFLNCLPIDSIFLKNPDLRPAAPNTALWRGYFATLEILETKLMINDIETVKRKRDENTEDNYYESIKSDVLVGVDSLKAFPYTGLLVLNDKLSSYNNSPKQGNDWCYILELDNGIVVKEIQFKNSMFDKLRKDQISAYKKTESYKKEKLIMRNEYGFSRSLINSIIERDIFFMTKKILF